MTEFGKKIAGLLSEALGVGAERLERAMQVEGWLMACHYYPPCAEPAQVVGSMAHTDPSLFTVVTASEGFRCVSTTGSGPTFLRCLARFWSTSGTCSRYVASLPVTLTHTGGLHVFSATLYKAKLLV
jgi:hypothetical protein